MALPPTVAIAVLLFLTTDSTGEILSRVTAALPGSPIDQQHHPSTTSIDEVEERQLFSKIPRIMDPATSVVLLTIVAFGATIMFSFLLTAILASFVAVSNRDKTKNLGRSDSKFDLDSILDLTSNVYAAITKDHE